MKMKLLKKAKSLNITLFMMKKKKNTMNFEMTQAKLLT